MALTGHLSDLSLSELIEFFCNQRKTGRLKVLYPDGDGYFYIQTGSVIDARVGVLRGIDAVYYALTLPNAKFEFSGASETTERTINQPWTQVVLEGLRRLDEGIVPPQAFPVGYVVEPDASQRHESFSKTQTQAHTHVPQLHLPKFLHFMDRESAAQRTPLIAGFVAAAVVISIAAIGVPAGWYNRNKVAVAASDPAASITPTPVAEPQPSELPTAEAEKADSEESTGSNWEATLAARRQRQKEKAKAREEKAALRRAGNTVEAASSANPKNTASKSGPKKVVVTVTYDESGRVTQASGSDATALRIARQKRFPAGRAGSATITIPIN
jgi:hypothetical protein